MKSTKLCESTVKIRSVFFFIFGKALCDITQSFLGLPVVSDFCISHKNLKIHGGRLHYPANTKFVWK